MRLLLVWMSTLLIAVLAPASRAQDAGANFPVKPVRWVVGFTPGASNDIIARTVGARLSELWGQQFIVDNRPGATGTIGGGRVRALAVTGPKRIASLPGVPTLAESGIKDGDATVWFGMAVPLKTPPAIVHKLNAGITQALASPDVNRRMADLGLDIVGGSAQDANRYVFDEAARIRGLLKAEVLKQE